MKSRSEIVLNLLNLGRIGWAYDPRKGKEVVVEHATGCVVQGDGVPAPRTRQIHHQREINPTMYRGESGFFEGIVQHMYLDPNDHVTIGIGHKLDNVDEAKTFKYYHKDTREPIEKDDVWLIEKDFKRVLKERGKRKEAIDFKDMTSLRIGIDAIETQFDADVYRFIYELGGYFNEFATYPKMAQLGMLDLAYNLGTPRFFHGFPRFKSALALRDWATVAKESHRNIMDKHNNIMGGMVNRNAIVQKWFLEALKAEPFFVNPHCPQKNVPMVRGYVA